MEVEVSGSKSSSGDVPKVEKDRVLVKRKTLQAVLEQCQRALELLENTGDVLDGDDEDDAVDGAEVEAEGDGSASPCRDREADELCDLLKSRLECPDFLEKLESAQVSVPQNISAEEGSSWDMINDNDLWEGGISDLDQENYVLVRQEDIVEGIACFMAAYLLSLKQTKELTPNQLQEGYTKTQHYLGLPLQPSGPLVE
ncbi:uncharacterized protein LOC100267834 isoform X2 [Vitis vinifera]|uniref:uncharacterized protein LOC100267834 isoform X2 n=1 Tax=Vitis vinifera TaxID=29760 RepID=UPI0028833393|nr:uncharacterized protein LOC100267834 isoform X2 [Vitis vinifera]